MVILLEITILLFLIQMSRMHTNTSFKKKLKNEEGGKEAERGKTGGGEWGKGREITFY